MRKSSIVAAAVATGAVVVVAAWLSVPATRRLTAQFFGALRMQNAQAVNVDLSSFTGPDANQTLQEMVTQMISDNVTTTRTEKDQTADTPASASALAGFQAHLPGQRADKPELAVTGAHAFHLVVDRSRLQAILKEAGRPDLPVPASIDGAVVDVQVPRAIHLRYGTCPMRSSAAANVATPPPPSALQYSDCVLLNEGPSPAVTVPAGLNLEQLAQTGLQLAGMTDQQATQFLRTVNWRSTLGLSIPRFMRSYETVKVNGVQGTLLNMGGRQGPAYTLIWAKDSLVYSLAGFGAAGDAVPLANSIQ